MLIGNKDTKRSIIFLQNLSNSIYNTNTLYNCEQLYGQLNGKMHKF